MSARTGAAMRRWLLAGNAASMLPAMPLPRLAWMITVGIALLTAALVLLAGYTGYALLSLAVAASAAINLT